QLPSLVASSDANHPTLSIVLIDLALVPSTQTWAQTTIDIIDSDDTPYKSSKTEYHKKNSKWIIILVHVALIFCVEVLGT
ncbi:hypothetical protein ACJX0J_018155, partial [Zea mays]